jgi:hypothetical protein
MAATTCRGSSGGSASRPAPTSLAAIDRRRAEQMVLPKVTDPLLVDQVLHRKVADLQKARKQALRSK